MINAEEQFPQSDTICESNDEEELEMIRESALKILDYGDNTCRDLFRKLLKKGYRRESVKTIIFQLSERDLLNDIRFAEQYVQNKKEAGKGPAWIRRKLEEKGVDRNIAEKTLLKVFDRSSERRGCLLKALELCGLKYEFIVDDQGNLQPKEDSSIEYGEEKVFERNVKNESNRVNIYRERERAKAGLMRKLLSSGFSQDAVMFAVRKISEL